MTEIEKDNGSRNVTRFSVIPILIIILFATFIFDSISYFNLKTLFQFTFIIILILSIIIVLLIVEYFQLKFELKQLEQKYKKIQ